MPGNKGKGPSRKFVGRRTRQRWKKLRENHEKVYGEVKVIIESLFPGEKDADLRNFILENVNGTIRNVHLQTREPTTREYIMHVLQTQSFWKSTEKTMEYRRRLMEKIK